MDADYLKRTVGGPLAEALASLVKVQPLDPVEFIGEALLDHVKRKETEAKREAHAARMEELLKEALKQEEERRAVAQADDVARKTKVAEEISVADSITNVTSHEAAYAKVIELLQARTGASAIQLGKKEAFDGQQVVSFIAVSKGKEKMLDETLKGLKEDEDSEEAMEEGVTFRVWKKTELPPPKEPVLDEDGEPIPDDAEPELIPPEHILVENVVREPAMKFYGIPKLGSYLAVPVTYSSWLHPGGVIKNPPEPPAAEAAGDAAEGAEGGEDPGEAKEDATDGEGKEAAEGGGADEGAAGGEGTGSEGKAVPPRYRKEPAPVQLVLCLDTMGQGRCFSKGDIAMVKEWGAKLAAAVEGVEDRMFTEECERLPKLTSEEAAAALEATVGAEATEAAVAAGVGALAADATDEDKAEAEQSAKYEVSVQGVEGVQDVLSSVVAKLWLCPPAPILAVLEAALTLVGVPKADLSDARGNTDWTGKARGAIGQRLVQGVMAADPTSETFAALALPLKESVEGMELDTVRQLNLPAVAILMWVKAAVAMAEKAEANRQAAAAAAEAEAEAAAAAAAAAAEEGADE